MSYWVYCFKPKQKFYLAFKSSEKQFYLIISWLIVLPFPYTTAHFRAIGMLGAEEAHTGV